MLALAAARCSRGVQLTRLSRGKARQVSDDAATKIKNLELEIKKLEHAAKMEELAATHALELKKLEMIRNANRGLFEKMGLKSETAKVRPLCRVSGGVTVQHKKRDNSTREACQFDSRRRRSTCAPGGAPGLLLSAIPLRFVVPVTVSSAAAILYFASLKTEIGEKITPLQKTEKFVHSILSGAGHFPKGALLRCACRGLVLRCRCLSRVSCAPRPVRCPACPQKGRKRCRRRMHPTQAANDAPGVRQSALGLSDAACTRTTRASFSLVPTRHVLRENRLSAPRH